MRKSPTKCEHLFFLHLVICVTRLLSFVLTVWHLQDQDVHPYHASFVQQSIVRNSSHPKVHSPCRVLFNRTYVFSSCICNLCVNIRRLLNQIML